MKLTDYMYKTSSIPVVNRFALPFAFQDDLPGNGLDSVAFSVTDLEDRTAAIIFHRDVFEVEVADRTVFRVETLHIERREEWLCESAVAKDRVFHVNAYGIAGIELHGKFI